MWNPATITALTAGVAGIIAAVFAGIAQIRHGNDPGAHGGQGHQ